MDLLHLVDRLEELVATAQRMPIGSRAIVDRRRLLDIVDQMRVAIPTEVREAQQIVEHCEELQREAEEEARLIVARAEERAARMVEDHDITLAARRRSEEMMVQGEARLEERIREANLDIESRIMESRRLAEQQMSAADDYARELLTRLERQLQAFARSVQSGIAQLEPDNPPPPAAPPPRSRADEAPPRTEQPRPPAPERASVNPWETLESGPREQAPRPAAGMARSGRSVQEAAQAVLAAMSSAAEPDAEPDDGGELQNLLDRGRAAERRSAPEPAPASLPAGDAVIDDYAMPPLDDEPPLGDGPPERGR
jgi:hypothetical protein